MKREHTEREQLLSALAWGLANLRENPEAHDSKGHPMGWVPGLAEAWEQNRAAAEHILERFSAYRSVDPPDPADLALFVEVKPRPVVGSVQMGGDSPLHMRVRRKPPPDADECHKDCRACAVERGL